MKSNSDAVLQSGPQSSRRRHSGTSVPSTVYGFQLSENQFQILNNDQTASSPRSSEQHQEGLVDPRTTRQQRWTTRGTASQETKTEEAQFVTVHYRKAQGTSSSGNFTNPDAIENSSQFVHSFSAGPSDNIAVPSVGPTVHYMLEPSVRVNGGGDSSLYSDSICNKRISYAGPEWSAGRPGHTPTRREFACDKHVEDSCAG